MIAATLGYEPRGEGSRLAVLYPHTQTKNLLTNDREDLEA
jgi:hypothetical protein